MWTESGEIDKNNYTTAAEKRVSDNIILQKSQHKVSQNLYFTLKLGDELFHNDNFQEKIIQQTCGILHTFFQKYAVKRHSKVLVVGLGNDKVTADSLGAFVVDKLFISAHVYSKSNIFNKYGNLCAIKCGVSGTTGISSYQIIQSVVDTTKPNLVIAVDTLASNSTANLATTIQLTDSGIEPGGGVNNPQQKLNFASLGVPIIAIGVPLVIYAKKILLEHMASNNIKVQKDLLSMVVTAKEIDFLINDYSTVIAQSINRIVHRS